MADAFAEERPRLVELPGDNFPVEEPPKLPHGARWADEGYELTEETDGTTLNFSW